MKLSDGSIRKLIDRGEITLSPPPSDRNFQPVSVDLTLSTSFCRPNEEGQGRSIFTSDTTLEPGGFLLASTQERIKLGNNLMGQVHGKSSWARLGLLVEAAGLVDPGFDGRITLELFNMSHRPLVLSAGTRICQITFERVDWPVERSYGHADLDNHYQGQTKATPGVRP